LSMNFLQLFLIPVNPNTPKSIQTPYNIPP
jgi:hypothetical protein